MLSINFSKNGEMMFKLVSETINGKFTVGKIYELDRVTEQGHPVLIDDENNKINIWDCESGFIPSCWSDGPILEEDYWNSVNIQVNCDDKDNYTIRGVADQIVGMAPELIAQKKHIEALIKRLIHSEKNSVYYRIKEYTPKEPTNDFIHRILQDKIETHQKFAYLPDDEVITW